MGENHFDAPHGDLAITNWNRDPVFVGENHRDGHADSHADGGNGGHTDVHSDVHYDSGDSDVSEIENIASVIQKQLQSLEDRLGTQIQDLRNQVSRLERSRSTPEIERLREVIGEEIDRRVKER